MPFAWVPTQATPVLFPSLPVSPVLELHAHGITPALCVRPLYPADPARPIPVGSGIRCRCVHAALPGGNKPERAYLTPLRGRLCGSQVLRLYF